MSALPPKEVPEEVEEELDRVFGAAERPTKAAPLTDDMVVLPKHYARYQIEPVHFLASNKVNVFQFNIVKYVMRCEHKHDDRGKQDILKIVRYTIMYGKYLQGDPDWWKPYYNKDLAAAIQEEVGDGTIYKRA